MSAFLGPIHYWLYNKIKIQNTVVEEIITFAEKEANINLRETLDAEFGFLDSRPLEEIIDTSNIHGWLQQCVSIVEYRMAYAITTLLKEKSELLDQLKVLFYRVGQDLSTLDQTSSVAEIFKYFNDTLLDGMPCDHANVLVSEKENEVIWKRNVCVHGDYWSAVGGDINNYYLFREEFIKGLLVQSGATFEKLDEVTSKIVK